SNWSPANSEPQAMIMEDSEALDEVVIVGYNGTTKSAKLSSASLMEDSIEEIPITSLDQLLSGKAAGENATIIIRGRNSLEGDSEPLFIIDGVPVDQDDYRRLDQNDIISISVLKGAEAIALYGNRGAGGVIIITTKNS